MNKDDLEVIRGLTEESIQNGGTWGRPMTKGWQFLRIIKNWNGYELVLVEKGNFEISLSVHWYMWYVLSVVFILGDGFTVGLGVLCFSLDINLW